MKNVWLLVLACIDVYKRQTYNNALHLMASLGVTIKEISIKESCIQHFNDINHDMNVHDVTYENSQARERTQILMDVANQMCIRDRHSIVHSVNSSQKVSGSSHIYRFLTRGFRREIGRAHV